MKNIYFWFMILLATACTKTEIIPIEYTGDPTVTVPCEAGKYEITDVAFGEYLLFLNVPGATSEVSTVSGQQVTKFYIDTCEVKKVNTLELLKTSSATAALAAAGVATATTKISNLNGIQYFTGLDTLKLTSNNLQVLDVSKNKDLIVLEMNFNFVKTLDLTNNLKLQRLRFKGSSQAPSTLKIQSIDLSKNAALRHLYLPVHRITSIELTNQPNMDELIDLTDNPGPDNDDTTPDILIPAIVYDRIQAAGGTLLGVQRGG
jgi:hypothetical protein